MKKFTEPTYVKNCNGTSDNLCSCKTWLNHWNNYSGISIYICSNKLCKSKKKKDLVGGHVRHLDNKYDNNWYILPICRDCNNSSEYILIDKDSVLVWANKSETCDKKYKCKAKTLKDKKCKRNARPGSDYCAVHNKKSNPDNKIV